MKRRTLRRVRAPGHARARAALRRRVARGARGRPGRRLAAGRLQRSPCRTCGRPLPPRVPDGYGRLRDRRLGQRRARLARRRARSPSSTTRSSATIAVSVAVVDRDGKTRRADGAEYSEHAGPGLDARRRGDLVHRRRQGQRARVACRRRWEAARPDRPDASGQPAPRRPRRRRQRAARARQRPPRHRRPRARRAQGTRFVVARLVAAARVLRRRQDAAHFRAGRRRRPRVLGLPAQHGRIARRPARRGDAQALSPDGKWVLAQRLEPAPAQLSPAPTGAGDARLVDQRQSPTCRRVHAGRQAVPVPWLRAGPSGATYLQALEGGSPKPVTPEGVIGLLVSPDGTPAHRAPSGRMASPSSQAALPTPASAGLRPGGLHRPLDARRRPLVVYLRRTLDSRGGPGRAARYPDSKERRFTRNRAAARGGRRGRHRPAALSQERVRSSWLRREDVHAVSISSRT